MSIYVITGIDVVDGEVHHSVVAKVTKDPKTGVIGCDMGRQVDRAELATLIGSRRGLHRQVGWPRHILAGKPSQAETRPDGIPNERQ